MVDLYSGTPSPQNARAGVANLEINGVAVDVASELSYDATLVKREYLVGQSGLQGWTENIKAGFISATLRDSATMSQANIVNIGPVSVIAILASGKIVAGSYLIATEVGAVNTAEGTFEVKFEGPVMESST
ncbi:phage tail tube protein [Komagataeibacter xylinus]|uniref:Phage tail protein n=1 Tax=Komagataeibacter xylinus TaxID=28448 RepID=A0A857FQ73_KOMXY|nr:phage tail tube protein [Komagataeibacter xylinus]QHC35350.1 phage tail protein [Komagataeibacter xylinus]